jgi:hypothetical protein
VPADVGARNCGPDSPSNGKLVDAQPVEVEAACRCVGEQPLRPGKGGVGKRAAGDRRESFGQRRLLQGDDDLDGIRVRRRGEREGK